MLGASHKRRRNRSKYLPSPVADKRGARLVSSTCQPLGSLLNPKTPLPLQNNKLMSRFHSYEPQATPKWSWRSAREKYYQILDIHHVHIRLRCLKCFIFSARGSSNTTAPGEVSANITCDLNLWSPCSVVCWARSSWRGFGFWRNWNSSRTCTLQHLQKRIMNIFGRSLVSSLAMQLPCSQIKLKRLEFLLKII